MSIQDILTLCGTAVPLLAGLLTFLVKFVRNEKAKRSLQTVIKLTEALSPMIVKAEEFSHYTGQEKKQFVLTQANQFAIDHKLKFDQDTAERLIEDLVATTKKVNARGKDLAAEQAKAGQGSPATPAAII